MWDVVITVTNLAERRVRAVATRTEGESVRAYSLATMVPQGVTAEEAATALSNQVWNAYQAELAEEAAHAAIVAQVATLTATKLDDKEPT